MSDVVPAAYQRGKRISFTRGDDFTIVRRLPEIPIGQGLSKAWFTSKDDLTVADPGALQKIITPTQGDDGIIFLETEASGKTITVVKFVLSQADTLSFRASENTYFYDMQGLSTAGHIGSLGRGMLEVIEQVTQAS